MREAENDAAKFWLPPIYTLPTESIKLPLKQKDSTGGTFDFGTTINTSYLPNENTSYFGVDYNLIDWLRQFSKDKDETYIRGFLFWSLRCFNCSWLIWYQKL